MAQTPTAPPTTDAGFGFIRWLDATLQGRYFPAYADVHRAYGTGGWNGVIVRAESALACLIDATDETSEELYDAWSIVLEAAEIEQMDAR